MLWLKSVEIGSQTVWDFSQIKKAVRDLEAQHAQGQDEINVDRKGFVDKLFGKK